MRKRSIKTANANTEDRPNHPRRKQRRRPPFLIWKLKQVTMMTTKRHILVVKIVNRWMKRHVKSCDSKIADVLRPDDLETDPSPTLLVKLKVVIVCNVGRSIARHYSIVLYQKQHLLFVIVIVIEVVAAAVVAVLEEAERVPV